MLFLETYVDALNKLNHLNDSETVFSNNSGLEDDEKIKNAEKAYKLSKLNEHAEEVRKMLAKVPTNTASMY